MAFILVKNHAGNSSTGIELIPSWAGSLPAAGFFEEM